MAIFVLEGLPGSGKTSLINDLSNDLGFFKVGEVINNKGKEIFPRARNITGQNFFFDNDSRKYALARKISSKNKHVLMDRGFFSTIGYNLCFKNEKYKNKILILEKKLKSIYLAKDLFYIYIRINVPLSLKRKHVKQRNNLNLWSFPENLVKIDNYYEIRLKNLKNCLILNGNARYVSIYKKVREFILVNS